jgi:metal-dependent amidase/aminoacylase/carboxypeptidase family protein
VGVNDPDVTALVRSVAIAEGQVPKDIDLKGPIMFSEDFAFMLEKVPGCYFGLGNGPSRNLHDPGYDFNDELLVLGPALYAAIIEKALPVR